MKKILSIILSATMALTIFFIFSFTVSAAEVTEKQDYYTVDKTIQNPDTTGGSNITMNGATIPAPTYTVTIPEKIEFGQVTKKLKNTPDADAIMKTSIQNVTLTHSNLFDNEKNVTVTVSTDNKIKNGANEIAFDLYEKSTTDTKITSGTTLFSIKPATTLVNEAESKTIYATLDQRLIKANGVYTGAVTFTVAMADNK